jgi:hypothetical protein
MIMILPSLLAQLHRDKPAALLCFDFVQAFKPEVSPIIMPPEIMQIV